MIVTRFPLAAAALLLAAQVAADTPARIAIIIDDLGYQLEAGQRAIDLPGPVAYAVLPGTPRGQRLARRAHEKGKEVLLHLPLQPVHDDDALDPGAILLDMNRTAFRTAFANAIAAVPFAVGVSSHRGSLLTRHPGHMSWLMAEISARQDLFFIDSYTTHESVALKIAAEAGVTATRRDVFLDHERTPGAVTREFERLKAMAKERGTAVAIGHPFPATLEMLEREIPRLREQGFELVTISELIEMQLNRI